MSSTARALRRRSSYNSQFQLWNKVKDKASRFVWERGGTTWKNGQQVGGSWKLNTIEVYIHVNENDIARLRSYEPGYLCKEEAGEGQQAGTTGAPTKGGSTNYLDQGKGLLNKISKP
ncbi:MAG: hypothetical protein IPN38_03855 [Flavobacteriales bacterium]|nr:hypothetical protein [Flavobacteriales bacterium]